jgi:hypothetical protein
MIHAPVEVVENIKNAVAKMLDEIFKKNMGFQFVMSLVLKKINLQLRKVI